MAEIKVVNIKCGGCANTVTKALKRDGYENISVDEKTGTILFDGEEKTGAIETLEKLGYPEFGSEKANDLLKKARSYASCMVGRMSKKE